MKRKFSLLDSVVGSFLALTVAAALFAPNALAVDSINAQTFNPSTSDRFVLLEDGFRSDWPKQSKFYLGANYNYVNEPLVATDTTQTARFFNIVNSIQTLDLMFGVRASSHLALFLGLPIHYISYPDFPGITGLPTGTATGMGDIKILGKIRLTDDTSNFTVAVIPEFHLPTGSTQNFVSDASTYLAARVAMERPFDAWTLVANLGLATAPNSDYFISTPNSQGIDYRKRFMFGVGGFVPFNDQWGASVEFSTSDPLPFNSNLNPNELYGGLRYVAANNLIFTGGGSLGKIGGASGQNYRVVLGIRYTIADEPAPTPMATPYPVATPAKPLAILRVKRIEILQPINFEFDSDRLTSDSLPVLNDVADIIIKNQKSLKKILVDGHTDHNGTDAYNLNLSIARSKSVKKYLLSRGVRAEMLEARGYGKRNPKVAGTDEKADAINRRVEFIVVK